MGKTRVCGGTCHKAKHSTCRCWCGGVFHGAAGAGARAELLEVFQCPIVPTTEKAFQELTAPAQRDLFRDGGTGERWRSRLADAVSARERASATRAAAPAIGSTGTATGKSIRGSAGIARRSTGKGTHERVRRTRGARGENGPIGAALRAGGDEADVLPIHHDGVSGSAHEEINGGPRGSAPGEHQRAAPRQDHSPGELHDRRHHHQQ